MRIYYLLKLLPTTDLNNVVIKIYHHISLQRRLLKQNWNNSNRIKLK